MKVSSGLACLAARKVSASRPVHQMWTSLQHDGPNHLGLRVISTRRRPASSATPLRSCRSARTPSAAPSVLARRCPQIPAAATAPPAWPAPAWPAASVAARACRPALCRRRPRAFARASRRRSSLKTAPLPCGFAAAGRRCRAVSGLGGASGRAAGRGRVRRAVRAGRGEGDFDRRRLSLRFRCHHACRRLMIISLRMPDGKTAENSRDQVQRFEEGSKTAIQRLREIGTAFPCASAATMPAED